MRLFLVSLATLAVTFILFSYLHFRGLKETYTPYDHPYLSGQSLDVIPWDQAYFLEKNPKFILWADLELGQDNELLVRPFAERNEVLPKEARAASPARPKLVELLQKYPNSRFILSLNINTPDIQKVFVKTLDDSGAVDRVLMQSDFDILIRAVKDLKPRLVFSNSASDLVRIRAFDSMWLLPALPLRRDVFISDVRVKNQMTFTDPIRAELLRRKVPLILGPIHDQKGLQEARRWTPEGIFVSDPLLLLAPST